MSNSEEQRRHMDDRLLRLSLLRLHFNLNAMTNQERLQRQHYQQLFQESSQELQQMQPQQLQQQLQHWLYRFNSRDSISIFGREHYGSSTSATVAPPTPRSAFPGAPLTASAVALKGTVPPRPPAMTSPAAAAAGAALAAGAPYRGATSWTPQGYAPAAAAAAAAVAQQAYRYTAPLPQPAYTAYTPHTATTPATTTTFKCYELESGPPEDIEISRPEALKLYKQMLICRRMENISAELYKQQKIRGFCHLYTGQEAVAVGMHAAMRRQDSLITAYRCHAWTYLMGVTVEAIIAELVGLRSGCSRGKGGSMHMYNDRFYGGNGIVGAQVPLGTGVALAHSYRQDGGVSIVCYGDGAANQGQLFESYNIAKLWCLPCIFVCENNKYGMGTRSDRAAACTDFYTRGHYIPGLWVDGNQVLAVRSATEFAIQHALEKGPLIMEMFTYRYVGHSMSDPGISYRTREEIEDARKHRDPIASFRKQLIKLDLACEEELKEMEIEVRKQIDEDKNKALKGREVDLNELAADVYAKNVSPKIRGVSGYNLEHVNISEVCLGKVKATPRSEIKDVPVGDAAMAAAMAKAKKAAAEKQPAEAKTQEKDAPKLEDKDKAVAPPKVEDKAKKAPEVKAPGEKAPGEKPPGVNPQGVNPPGGKTPGVKASEVKPPDSKAPKAKSPEVKAPEVKAPEVKTPEVKAPPADKPK